MREDLGNYRSVRLTSVPGEITENLILGAVERHLKSKAITRHSQHGFTEGMSCLTNVMFDDKVICPMTERKVVDIVSLDFRFFFYDPS